jgi:phosphopantothenoylcysteine decarboxylase/phosphopantothenate--cysteine ligase
MTGPLANKNVVLGVTGSIACYKSLDLASKLVQAGAIVDTILSYGATQFVTPLAFRSITHREVVTDLFDANSTFSIEHVALAKKADIMVIAPATIHCIAKLAAGLADDPLSTTAIATQAPILLAPAMDANMFDHPATQDNLLILQRRGAVIAGPETGRLASGLVGPGRLLDTSQLIGYISTILGRKGDLMGRTIVVSAGGTREPIDPARVIANHSSGKMGYAIAHAARNRGAEVVLVTASTSLSDPVLMRVVHVQTAQQMSESILEEIANADALIMAAAVSDFRPTKVALQKLKKAVGQHNIPLSKTPDILTSARGNFIKVGFSAESEHLITNAQEKLRQKSLDLIVANDITDPQSGFGTDTNKATLIDRNLQIEELPLMTKYQLSDRILDRVRGLFRN